ncbi:sensor histidine kinase [Halomonas sp. M20]|uniref:sensor histidine kinase n=1 Tax=Halomonas sp. M20 TaxID=2763264 RepID=UPI001D0B9373|nr:sensor histidine kinase [Halomonas sp. M20]
MTARDSLYRRLLAWLLLPLLGLAVLILWQAYLGARDTADRAFDRLLEAASLAIAEQVKWQDDRLWLDMPPAALEMLATDAEERVFYALYAAEDEFVTGNAHLPALEGDSAPLRFADVGWQNQTLRLGIRNARLEDWNQREYFEVRVAHTREGRERLASSLFHGSLVRIALLALLATSVLVLAIRFALAPLTRLRRAIRARDPRTLAPLKLSLPRELAELREALNELLSRMRRVRANQERFIGDASHQLRTPLAGLSARAELALRQDDPSVWRDSLCAMQSTSNSAARLAVQLLSLTRLNNPEATPELRPLDLNQIARRATRNALPACQRAGIDLGVEVPENAVIVSGIDWQLEEALSNLIDNARRYGSQHDERHQEAPRITVRVQTAPPILAVEDNGPGIPPHLHLRVLRPFYRGQHSDRLSSEGSGLGLAIVEGIARSHGARLSLEEAGSGHGLNAVIRFPETPS